MKDNKEKLLVIDLGKAYGGAEKLIENIILGLKDDFDITLAINNYGDFIKKSDCIKEFKILAVNNGMKTFINTIINLVNYVNSENIKIVHCHGTPSNIVGIILKKICKVKFITTIHSDLEYEFQGKKKLVYLKIQQYTVKYADHIVTVSKDLSNKFCEKYKKHSNKIQVIYNGMDMDYRGEMSNKNKEFTFLFVGRLVEIKNVEYLIDGLKYLKDNGKNFICNIIGEGEQEDSLREYVDELQLSNNVNFLGFKDKVCDYMRKSDALIMTSKMEGIPLVVIEAFANKLPVISSAVGGVVEMIDDHNNGILYDLGEKDAFKEILISIVEGKYDLEKIKENAFYSYQTKWSRKRLLNEYKQVFFN